MNLIARALAFDVGSSHYDGFDCGGSQGLMEVEGGFWAQSLGGLYIFGRGFRDSGELTDSPNCFDH